VFLPQLNFSGRWQGKSTYTDNHLQSENLRADLVGSSVVHQARIEQNCLSIQLTPAVGEKYEVFQSTAVNLISKNKLVYAYEVRYKKQVGLPTDTTYGYEEVQVVDTEGRSNPGDKVRPSELRGWFAHCAKGQKPVYSGTVVFQRVVDESMTKRLLAWFTPKNH
jgi:hypothetical protein